MSSHRGVVSQNYSLAVQIMTEAFDKASRALERENAALLDMEEHNLRVMTHRFGVMPKILLYHI